MALPKVDSQAISTALQEFDQSLRGSPEWIDWEHNKAQVWVIQHEGRIYPPKKIISLATGVPVREFSGGPETNSYLESLGYRVGKLRDIALSDAFELILDRYREAKANQSFGGNHEIRELFTHARKTIEQTPGISGQKSLHVVASYGKGNWATIPWISVLDERETRTTQSGTYIVFLFREGGAGMYLKLGQGVTIPDRELGARAPGVLATRAAKIREHVLDLSEALSRCVLCSSMARCHRCVQTTGGFPHGRPTCRHQDRRSDIGRHGPDGHAIARGLWRRRDQGRAARGRCVPTCDTVPA